MLRKIVQACLSFETRFYMLSQIMEITGMGRKEVRHRLWKLEAAGLITKINCREIPLPGFSKGRPTKEICYRNTKALEKKAVPPRRTKDNGWDTMWKTVRAMRRFTRNDLAIICNQRIDNVRYFTKRYRQFGYIRPLKERGRNVPWMLIKDPGPKRPLTARIDSGQDGKTPSTGSGLRQGG
ncbi:MAG TPA: hypothetical protein ENG80_00810 [Nitrospirae bacterium]|nr:hypothetical protein [Nitrospirota bacterium]HDH51255.1 hypothetical protein [Nitrospirota bacterium]HDK81036.1 hypothetical protein [Nitrospirota bacterium]